MSTDPASIHGARYVRIGKAIRDNVEPIAHRWRERCSRTVSNASAEELDSAETRMREFLQSLASQLTSSQRHSLGPQQSAAEWGTFRWKLGWDLRQVVREYMLLRLILLDELDHFCETPLSRDEVLAIGLNFDEAIAAAVTTYVRHEEQLRDEYERKLVRSNRELKRFAHVVAHELKSPLNAQHLGIQLIDLSLSRAVERSQLDQILDSTRQAVKQMSGLIDELLRYAEVGHAEAELQPTRCREIVESALQTLQGEISTSEARIEYGDLPVVNANPATLGLVFQNLIANAIQYRGQGAPKIHISASPEDRMWRFVVADNGSGIAEEDRKRIFEMFSRADPEARPDGTGIGLAMCRQIVEQHGGSIWVESQLGAGSRFCFTLPAAGDPHAAKDNSEPRSAPVA